jgi:type I pantothenate kinase
VTTDGFLYPNRILEERGLMKRKGFPESYDQRRLIRFLADVKAGEPAVAAPVYSHLHYDIVPGAEQRVERPHILIVEGLNVLQSPSSAGRDGSRVFVSDFFDFSIYIDAPEQTIEQWYVQRFLRLRETVFQRTDSYFHRYARLTETEAVETAQRIWEEINLLNLRENIRPTRERAHLILHKGEEHAIEKVQLQRL